MIADADAQQAERSLERAICHLLMPMQGGKGAAQPFFASLCMELERVPKDEAWFKARCPWTEPTAATDGHKLYYFPPFINSLTEPLLKSLLLHEVLHAANNHCTRRKGRDAMPWNVACDFVVNAMIKNDCRGEVGPDWLLDPTYDGLAAEEVYARLIQEQKKQGGGGFKPGNGNGPGAVLDASMSGQDDTVTEKIWQQRIVSAAKAAGRGNVPGCFAHLVDEILNPKVPWQTLLRRFVQAVSKADYDWSRPNKRFSWQGIHLPSLHSPKVGAIAMAIDTSGSTSDVWGQFLDESQAVLDECQPEKLTFLQCDCAIATRAEYQPGDTIPRLVGGGGGSDTSPVFDELAKDGELPLCCVYLTDGYISYPEEPPPYPVLWIMTTDQTPPWGEVVRM